MRGGREGRGKEGGARERENDREGGGEGRGAERKVCRPSLSS